MMGIEMPLEWAVLLSVMCAFMGVRAGQIRARRNPGLQLDPMRELLHPTVLASAIDLAARRDARRQGSHAVMHGRIDQLSGRDRNWSADTRDQVREHVAAVMRAGLRRGDRMVLGAAEHDLDGFTILIPGADERAAVRIANRLRELLTHLRMPQLGSNAHLTASFGVAANRFGETGAGLDDRAQCSLAAAVAKGRDHVVPASEIEEVLFLPAPAPSEMVTAA